MKNILKITATLLIIAGSFVSCEKEDDISSLEGTKWKLVKTTHPMSGQSSDYSHYNIVYEFKANNILIVSGQTDNIDVYRGHEVGEHFYSIVDEEEANEMIGIPNFRLKINTIYYMYQISSKKLIIDNSPLDGGIYNFNRIK